MSAPSREIVGALARVVGLDLTDERLDGLVVQAGPYLDLIRALDGMPAAVEPAAVFRLDDQETSR
jgi:hypothetical protein